MAFSGWRFRLRSARAAASRTLCILSWTARSPLALCLALLAFAAFLAHSLDGHYAIRDWLFWRYAGYWSLSLVFSLACLSAGHLVIDRLKPYAVPLREHLLLSFAAGMFVFSVGMLLAGLLHLYGPAWFVAWPLVLTALGGVSLFRFLRRAAGPLRAVAGRPGPALGLRDLVVFAFGLIGLVLVYVPVVSPENTAYDAQWYHLATAEHYVAQGYVAPMVEGSFNPALPKLATFLYTWAFLLPQSTLFDRVELCAHIEFVIFLWTLYGVLLLVRWVAPRTRTRFAWAALFLFPGIWVYDSNLVTASDHIVAFWGIPIWFAFRRAMANLRPRACLLLALMIAGAVMTKYQALVLAAYPLGWFGLRIVQLVRTPNEGRASPLWARVFVLRGPALAGVAGIVLTAPHWLLNTIWHGDPFYPFLHKYLPSHPWTLDADILFDSYYTDTQMWRPKGPLPARLSETLRACLTFAFEPHDWSLFHRDVPVFGFLFTAVLLCAVFVRGSRRLWSLVIAGHVGIFVWYWGSHQDRYLQALLPWFAAAVGGFISLVWRTHWAPRLALCGLLSLQVIWGGDAPFIPHPMMGGKAAVKAVADLISSGYRKDFDPRTKAFGDLAVLGSGLPAGAKVLVHEMHMKLGLQATSVSDAKAWQGGISYGRIRSPRELYEQLRSWGVTHVLWEPGKSWDLDSLAGEFVFYDFTTRYTVHRKNVGHLSLAELPAKPPPDRAWLDERGMFLLGPGSYPPGVYRIGDATVLEAGNKRPVYPASVRSLNDPEAEPGSVAFVAYSPDSKHPFPPSVPSTFTQVATRGNVQLWVRSVAP